MEVYKLLIRVHIWMISEIDKILSISDDIAVLKSLMYWDLETEKGLQLEVTVAMYNPRQINMFIPNQL